VGLIGFSFGAPQGVIASTARELQGHLSGVVGFGGYCDLERTLHFQFTGEHEWEGRSYHAEPDPYGRWVVGANFLAEVPELSDAGDVAEALRRLASEAGDLQIDARAPVLDPLKARLRHSVAADRRRLFDLFAPETGRRPDPHGVKEIIEVLGPAVRRTAPLMDPLPHLAPLTVPVRLIHGRQDVLIPWSESARLRAALPRDADVGLRLTGLFAHSTGNRPPSVLLQTRESLQFLGALREVLELV
jgi:pimeloyl-ACP methyl ester carboxylesterase